MTTEWDQGYIRFSSSEVVLSTAKVDLPIAKRNWKKERVPGPRTGRVMPTAIEFLANQDPFLDLTLLTHSFHSRLIHLYTFDQAPAT